MITVEKLTALDIVGLQQSVQQQILNDFGKLFDSIRLPTPLDLATRYAILGSGKRVRPLLVLATYLSLNHPTDLAMVRRAMIAIESIHGYSLVHDDLPCMDDDDLRRGKPTCHIVHGEATALLAGDVLQSIAFEALLNPDWLAGFDAGQAGTLAGIVASGARRMVAGQQLDLMGENQSLSQEQLQAIHQDKTGALIEAAVLMGAVCANADKQTRLQLGKYAHAIGLAFQVQDDVLDVIADTQTLGKPSGSDEKLQKSTYVKLLGIDGASRYADELFCQARQAVAGLGADNLLIQLSNWLQQRHF
ncbi:polyprenyl synthetase family protein [Moraxella cuniculi]|uniref:Farnesyl diphosphate synthase n=1 Tax=Moraxella cuniculi TaxID=34061 RepID=A0A3S4UST8_9GAMM|nr:farnesyl diphosphate synthase [Moraxella cuniculi]VEG12185.1 Farnesyl diphosphate synthase [Moraxella cuniculi]